MSKEADECECCRRPGKPVGAGDAARIRCARHEYVMDAGEWVRAWSGMTCAFETVEELMSYFMRDYGAGVDMMGEVQRDPDGSDPETKH